MSFSKEEVLKALSNVIEPDLKKDLVTLNLVHDLTVDGKKISMRVGISSPAMHSKMIKVFCGTGSSAALAEAC